jgi:nitric oxide dioxygenase
MITATQKTAIRNRTRGLTAMPVEAGQIFYDALFRKVPEVRAHFDDDISAQAEKLVDLVFLVVHFLDNIDALTPEIEDLGVRHVDYDVQPAHLDAAREAFLEALEATFDDWAEADRDAWNALLAQMVALMVRGMAQEIDSRARRDGSVA